MPTSSSSRYTRSMDRCGPGRMERASPELACQGKHRVHGRSRILEYQGDLSSAEGLKGPGRFVRHIDSVDENGAGHDAGRGFQPDKTPGEKAFPASGFPHKSVDFSLAKGKIHIPEQDPLCTLFPDCHPKTAGF